MPQNGAFRPACEENFLHRPVRLGCPHPRTKDPPSAARYPPVSPQIMPVAACDYVVFGGTGDLALRKLLPSLYQRERDRQLPEAGRIIGVSRSPLGAAGYVAKVEEGLHRYI